VTIIDLENLEIQDIKFFEWWRRNCARKIRANACF